VFLPEFIMLQIMIENNHKSKHKNQIFIIFA